MRMYKSSKIEFPSYSNFHFRLQSKNSQKTLYFKHRGDCYSALDKSMDALSDYINAVSLLQHHKSQILEENQQTNQGQKPKSSQPSSKKIGTDEATSKILHYFMTYENLCGFRLKTLLD